MEISIVIPVFNVEKYINKMLKSIYNQTFNQFEVIIVNDGSTDKSEDIILKYKQNYDNLIYIKQKNKGVSEARNLGMNYVSGKYTLFLDSDDFINECMLEKLYIAAEEKNADIVICNFRKVYDDYSKNINNTFNFDETKIYNNQEVIDLMLNLKVSGFLWNKLFLTQNILKNKMNFQRGRIIEDWLPVVKEVMNSNRIVFINEILYYYRQRDTSYLHNKSVKNINDYNYAIKSICNFVNESEIFVNKASYYNFISQTQTTEIKVLIKLGNKINNSVYKKYSLISLSLFDIFFKTRCSLSSKIKLILYKINLLHLFLKIIKK